MDFKGKVKVKVKIEIKIAILIYGSPQIIIHHSLTWTTYIILVYLYKINAPNQCGHNKISKFSQHSTLQVQNGITSISTIQKIILEGVLTLYMQDTHIPVTQKWI